MDMQRKKIGEKQQGGDHLKLVNQQARKKEEAPEDDSSGCFFIKQKYKKNTRRRLSYKLRLGSELEDKC